VARTLSTVDLEPAVVTGQLQDGNIVLHRQSHFLDVIIGGRSLRELVGDPARDLLTNLNRPWLPNVAESVDELLGRTPSQELRAGRIALLVCSVCGDLGCGQLTAALNVSDAEVSWSDFLWEDDHSDPTPVEHLRDPVHFDRSQYEAALTHAPERVAALPYDESAHRGRRFLWPWQWGWRLPPS
jgi:hypothetical protein